MPRPCRIRYAGAKYHVSARGNGRQRIFFQDEDYERFLDQLFLALEKDQAILYAYSLMPNHYHLFVETPLGNIHRFEQRLNTAYGMYYRFKHHRPGHCFQGRYAGPLVGGDDYIIRLTRYIHLNPIETETMKRKSLDEQKAYLHGYPWSSLPGYLRKDRACEWVDYRWLGLMHRATETGNRRAYRAYVESMIGKEDEVLAEAFAASQYAIGDKRFIEEAEADLKEMRMRKGLYGDLSLPVPEGLPIEQIETVVAQTYKTTSGDLHQHGHKVGVAKAVAIELCCMLSGRTQRDIARHFGFKTDAGVNWQRGVLREKTTKDPGLQKQIERLVRKLSGGKL